MRTPLAVLSVATASLCVACFAGGPRFSPDPQPALSSEEVELGGLGLFITDQTNDGHFAKMRGKIINPYNEPIDGIRMIYRDIAVGEDLRVLSQLQKVLGGPIEAGGSKLFRWDIESMYLGGGGTRFHLMAFAIKRNGQVLPLPPGWRADSE